MGQLVWSRLPARAPRWRNGRRVGLKNRCPQGRAGSTPALGTTPDFLSRALRARLNSEPGPMGRVSAFSGPLKRGVRTPSKEVSVCLGKAQNRCAFRKPMRLVSTAGVALPAGRGRCPSACSGSDHLRLRWRHHRRSRIPTPAWPAATELSRWFVNGCSMSRSEAAASERSPGTRTRWVGLRGTATPEPSPS